MEMTNVSAPYRFFNPLAPASQSTRLQVDCKRLLQVDITRAHINRDINFTRSSEQRHALVDGASDCTRSSRRSTVSGSADVCECVDVHEEGVRLGESS